MQAIGNTKQGKSGWYMNPDGSVYYYQNNRGTWNGLAGPLSSKQFTLASEANSKISRHSDENSVLTRVHFDLIDSIAANHGPRARISGSKSRSLFVVYEAADFIKGNPTHETGPRSRSSSLGRKVSFD